MTPGQGPTRRQDRYLILNPVQALANIMQFREALCPLHSEPPEHWLAVSHGMIHFLCAASDVEEAICALPALCASDMRMVLEELERFVKPDILIGTILNGKGVIQHGRNGEG